LYQVGWFSTGRGPGSRQLLKTVQESIEKSEIKARLAFVFCSREPGESPQTDLFFDQVKSYGIPLVCYSYDKFKAHQGVEAVSKPDQLPSWRLLYDREVMKRLKGFQPDLCLLAGYMLIVGEEMCRRYVMLNLHPAAPSGPAGTWQQVIWKLIEQHAEQSGVMMHLVTPQLDKGPVVTYCTFSLRRQPFDQLWQELGNKSLSAIQKEQNEDYPLFRLIRQQGVVREQPLIVATLKAFSEGRVKVQRQQVFNGQGRPVSGYDLTREIEAKISGAKL
jgi:phosphoribosylglycinamide formyltransferase-1